MRHSENSHTQKRTIQNLRLHQQLSTSHHQSAFHRPLAMLRQIRSLGQAIRLSSIRKCAYAHLSNNITVRANELEKFLTTSGSSIQCLNLSFDGIWSACNITRYCPCI